jgi:aminoglycoside phosphotransferase family enzyme
MVMKKFETEHINHSELKKKDMPSAVEDAANVMSRYHKKTKRIKDQKHSFPEIDYERPPHY